MFLGVEYRLGVPGIVGIGISSVVSFGFTGLVELLVTSHGISGSVALITISVASVLLVIVSIGSAISVLKSLRLKR